MVLCAGYVGTWTATPPMTKSSLTAHWLLPSPSGAEAGELQAGTPCAGMNVRGPAQRALRTSRRSIGAPVSADLWPLAQEAPLLPAMPTWHLRASSRAVFWMSAWAVGPMTYYARLWLPMPLPARLLALSSRTGGHRPAVVSAGVNRALGGAGPVSVELVWFHSSPSGSFCFFLFVFVTWCFFCTFLWLSLRLYCSFSLLSLDVCFSL